jgi:hypothetical protein
MDPTKLTNDEVIILIKIYRNPANEKQKAKVLEMLWGKYEKFVNKYVWEKIKASPIDWREKDAVVNQIYIWFSKALDRYDLGMVGAASFISFLAKYMRAGWQEYAKGCGVVKQKNMFYGKKQKPAIKPLTYTSLNQPVLVKGKPVRELHEEILTTDAHEYEYPIERILKGVMPIPGRRIAHRLTPKQKEIVWNVMEGYRNDLNPNTTFKSLYPNSKNQGQYSLFIKARRKILRHFREKGL